MWIGVKRTIGLLVFSIWRLNKGWCSFARIYIIRRRKDFKREKCLEVLNLKEKYNFLLEKFGGMENS